MVFFSHFLNPVSLPLEAKFHKRILIYNPKFFRVGFCFIKERISLMSRLFLLMLMWFFFSKYVPFGYFRIGLHDVARAKNTKTMTPQYAQRYFKRKLLFIPECFNRVEAGSFYRRKYSRNQSNHYAQHHTREYPYPRNNKATVQ